MNFFGFLCAQFRWSNNTFGIGPRFKGNMEHIRRELAEIESNPTDPVEYADVIILACDTAMRQGISPHELCKALQEKQLVNFKRQWFDITEDAPPKRNKCIQHDWRFEVETGHLSCFYCGEVQRR